MINQDQKKLSAYADIRRVSNQYVQKFLRTGEFDWQLADGIKANGYSGGADGCFYVNYKKNHQNYNKNDQFKLHVAINDLNNINGNMDENLEKGYNIADRVLRENLVSIYKVELPGLSLDRSNRPGDNLLDKAGRLMCQARKQITIYSEADKERLALKDWMRLLDEMTLTFIDQEVEPKPRLMGEHDVCVKGSMYITYRSESLIREYGGRYYLIKQGIKKDPLHELRLSDCFYLRLLEELKRDAVLTADSIMHIVEESLQKGWVTADGLNRVIAHIQSNKWFGKRHPLDQQLLIGTLQSAQKDLKINKNDEASAIAEYEVYTGFSQAAAEYNQLITDVCEKIKLLGYKELGDLQEQRASSELIWWLSYNKLWEEEISKKLSCDLIELRNQPLPAGVFLVKHDAAKIAALTSPLAIKNYIAEAASVNDLLQYDAATIERMHLHIEAAISICEKIHNKNDLIREAGQLLAAGQVVIMTYLSRKNKLLEVFNFDKTQLITWLNEYQILDLHKQQIIVNFESEQNRLAEEIEAQSFGF